MTVSLKSAGRVAALAIAFGLVALQPASARDLSTAEADGSVLTQRVSLKGMDLSSAADLRRLDTKLRSASRRVCETGEFKLINFSEKECRRGAFDGAQAQVASLVKRNQALAAAGLPITIQTEVAVVAPERQ